MGITYAMNEVMDAGVGRILETLDALGLEEDTIVLFTSDNGPAFNLRPDQVPAGYDTDCKRYNCGLNGQKGSVYEGGIRVPMIARWPSGLPGRMHLDQQVHFVDWLPTLLAAAGIERSEGRALDGRKPPVLRGYGIEPPPRFWQLNGEPADRAVRDGPWKLVRPQQRLLPASEEDQRIMIGIEVDIRSKITPRRTS